MSHTINAPACPASACRRLRVLLVEHIPFFAVHNHCVHAEEVEFSGIHPLTMNMSKLCCPSLHRHARRPGAIYPSGWRVRDRVEYRALRHPPLPRPWRRSYAVEPRNASKKNTNKPQMTDDRMPLISSAIAHHAEQALVQCCAGDVGCLMLRRLRVGLAISAADSSRLASSDCEVGSFV